jgi:ribosomal protein L9
MAEGDKLYGAISAGDIVDLFAAQGISVAKNQIEFGKAIKTKGAHEFTVKLSSTLKPVCTIKVIPE